MSASVTNPGSATLTWPARIALTLALSLLLAVSARIQVPFWPVPMTLQMLTVLSLAGLFGARIAGGAVLAYLVEGAAGLPVFAAGGGLAYLTGPTAGYLLGFLVAAVAVGELARRAGGRPLAIGAAMLAGVAIVYALGAAWLGIAVGPERALSLGVLPFLLVDAVKATLATALVLALKRPAKA